MYYIELSGVKFILYKNTLEIGDFDHHIEHKDKIEINGYVLELTNKSNLVIFSYDGYIYCVRTSNEKYNEINNIKVMNSNNIKKLNKHYQNIPINIIHQFIDNIAILQGNIMSVYDNMNISYVNRLVYYI